MFAILWERSFFVCLATSGVYSWSPVLRRFSTSTNFSAYDPQAFSMNIFSSPVIFFSTFIYSTYLATSQELCLYIFYLISSSFYHDLISSPYSIQYFVIYAFLYSTLGSCSILNSLRRCHSHYNSVVNVFCHFAIIYEDWPDTFC